MEVRTRKIANKNEIVEEVEVDSEADLLKFCSEQISKMKKHLKLDNEEGFPSFYEINSALMGYLNIYLSLSTIYYTAKHEHSSAKNEYDDWYAHRYTEIRQQENPKSTAATKWISTKEIEFILRMRFTEENSKRLSNLNLLDEKVSFMRRMLEGWKSHQFVLTQLSKNVMGESQGKEFD